MFYLKNEGHSRIFQDVRRDGSILFGGEQLEGNKGRAGHTRRAIHELLRCGARFHFARCVRGPGRPALGHSHRHTEPLAVTVVQRDRSQYGRLVCAQGQAQDAEIPRRIHEPLLRNLRILGAGARVGLLGNRREAESLMQLSKSRQFFHAFKISLAQ